MNGLQLGDRQIRVSMAKAPARPAPEQRHGNDLMAINLIQAQAQARLMQLPAFNMLLPVSGVYTNSAVKSKRPHQDPDKVIRTVFVEHVGDDMDESGLAEYFGHCGEVTAVRLAGTEGSRKAWIEFGTKEAARSAREYDNTVLGSATVRVRPSKTAIHTNGLQREQDSNSGSKTPSPSRTGDTNSPNSQMLASSRHSDRHTEVAQQPAQLRNHAQAPTTGTMSQHGQGPQPALHLDPSTAEAQQHAMANVPPDMIHQQPQQQQQHYATNGSGYAGVAGSMPMLHGPQPIHMPQQHGGYKQMPPRPSGIAPRSSNQNHAPGTGPTSGRASPGLKRAYEDVQQSNANAAAAAAAFLSKQQQQTDDKRMRMSH
ncbi:hypothetical protein ABBQ38_007228 [Trebouxia sp. C0009 RCD-2024]